MLNKRAGNLSLVLLLSVLCIIETLCFTYFKKLPFLAEVNSLVYLSCGIAIVAVAGYFAFVANSNRTVERNATRIMPQLVLAGGLLVFLGVLYYDYGMRTYPSWPLSHKDADMLPLIKKACERLLTGKDVYAYPVEGLWEKSYIPYLPAMWGAFLPAVAAGVDIRWTLLIVSLLGYMALMFPLLRLNYSKAALAIPVFFTLFFVLTKFFTWEDKQFFLSLAQEEVPGFFYLLLFIAFMLKRPCFIAVMLALCTLSRYSLVLFVPVYFLWLLIDKDYKVFVRTGLMYAGLLLVLFILPFFIQRPAYFLNITGGYMQHDQAFWLAHIEGTKPAANLGLVYFVGYNIPVLQMLKPVMLALIIVWSATWLLLYYRYSYKLSANKEIWVMIGLKVTLILFYNFISMPYQYLFIVPTIISYPLLLAVIKKADFSTIKQ